MAGKATAAREPSLDEQVEKAWDEAEKGDEELREGQPRNEDGTFAGKPGEEEPVEEETPAGEGEPVEEEVPADEEAPAEEEVPAGEEAPAGEEPPVVEEVPGAAAAAAAGAAAAGAAQKYASWRPAEREALLSLKGPEGEVVRAAAARREAQMSEFVRETEQVRRFANDFAARAEPYRPLYAMLNVTPTQAFDVLMRSAAVLYQGDARMKAQTVAEMIRERGVDVELVADYLDGKTATGEAVPRPDPQLAQLTQTVQSLQQQLGERAQADEQRAQELADRHVASWAKDKPWYADVRKRMGMLVKAAEAEGETLTLDQAYATAISLDPEISKLEAKRVAAENVKKLKADAERARRAGRSPRPSPAARGARGASSGGIEDDVSAAWDEAEGKVG